MVIVESPTKVKTINKMLGRKFKVVSSMGHLVDLPKSTIGVDVDNDFNPKLIVVRAKQKHLTKLKKEAKSMDTIYFATDPDREGEAIGWNLIEHLAKDKKVFRVTFQEITKEAVLKAFEHPREFDQKRILAQVTRRILDRIVGYKISPLLWRKVGSRLSAGRVQSVALRIIVERERAITSFIPQEYWQLEVDLKKEGFDGLLTASLERVKDEKPEIVSEGQMNDLLGYLKDQKFIVSNISERQIKRKSSPPLITSTMQQEAFNKLRFNASKTMKVAQELYEGIDLGGETTGLITYMRTDSVRISNEAMEKVREYILGAHGEKYLPEEPNVYKSKKSAQDAHEAIRPSDVNHRPQDLQDFLSDDQYKLYELIWRRFVAAQMVPSIYQNRKMEVLAGDCRFGAAGSTLIFDGYLALELDERQEEKMVDFSHYEKEDILNTEELKPTQHFTKPPARYSDASLVKALEEDGIGRPSTYAAIIHTLVFRNYVSRERGYFTATELGMQICDLLVEYFPKIMDIGFTAQMEESLDQVEEGNLDHVKLLHEFYEPFSKELEHAEASIEKTENFVDKKCPECDRQMVLKWGRRGKFLSCSGFPECKHAEAITSGVKCPQPDCEGELVKRRSRIGKSFYGCSKYPTCTFISNELPKTEEEDAESVE